MEKGEKDKGLGEAKDGETPDRGYKLGKRQLEILFIWDRAPRPGLHL